MRLEIWKKHRFVGGNYNFGHEFDVTMGHSGKEVPGLGLRRETWFKKASMEKTSRDVRSLREKQRKAYM